MPNSLAGRLALITGASRGIGRAVTLALARAGAHPIILARSGAALEELDDEIRALGRQATIVQLDLAKLDRIDALGPTIFQRWGRLDILIANAGVLGPLSPLPHVSADAWQQVIDVNLSANWRLIRTLDPVLQKSDAGRAVFVSTGAAKGKVAFWGPYAASKAGLEAMVTCYAAEVATTNLRVNLVNPGPVRTRMRAQAYPGEDPATLPSPEQVAELFLELVRPTETATGTIVNYKDWRAAQQR